MAVFELTWNLFCADHGVCDIQYVDLKWVVGKYVAAEQSHQYNVVRWLGYLHMLVIMPGKLQEATTSS